MPRWNHSTRWADDPCVKRSGITRPVGHLLQTIVADRRGGADRLVRVTGVELHAAGLKASLLRTRAWPQTPAKQSAWSSSATDALFAPLRDPRTRSV